MHPLISQINDIFKAHFSSQALFVRAPGRINLIGEHTDYNGGLVLPAAIDKATYLAIAPASSGTGTWISVDMNDHISVDFQTIISSPDHQWANYILGVIEQYNLSGQTVAAFDCVIAGDIPIGSGLSSSASLESAIAFAINHLQDFKYTSKELALLVQKAENQFIGVQCGIMDMFASLHGKAQHVMRLNCESLDYTYFPLDLGDYSIILFDSGVKHNLVESAYNLRREQCNAGLAYFRANFDPTLPNLSQVPIAYLEASQATLDPIIYKRCQYVIEENSRILGACNDLLASDLSAFGIKMTATHQGLRHLYEVSCPELDFLVDSLLTEPAVLGSRLMGGGFGGCTINLVKTDHIEEIYKNLSLQYLNHTGIQLKMHIVKTADGVGLYPIES